MEVAKFAIQVAKHMEMFIAVLVAITWVIHIVMGPLLLVLCVVILKQQRLVVVVVVVDHVTHVVHQLLVVTVLPYLVALPHMDQRQ